MHSVYPESVGAVDVLWICIDVLQLGGISHLSQDWRSEVAAESCSCNVKRFCR